MGGRIILNLYDFFQTFFRPINKGRMFLDVVGFSQIVYKYLIFLSEISENWGMKSRGISF